MSLTAKYDELSAKDIVFGELRNCMDMAVVAALIASEDLLARAQCSLPLLTNPDGDLMIDTWNAPKTVATQCSFTKKGSNWIITASGGIQITSWEVANRSEKNDHVGSTRQKASANRGDAWWWN